jgi:hypothetical protein
MLLAMLRKKNDIPFRRIFVLFVAFMLLCRLTHLIDATIFGGLPLLRSIKTTPNF